MGFVVHLYGRYFLSAPLSTAAPRHDLTFWYDLKQYHLHEPDIAEATMKSMRRHLWYLTPELVILSLFDEELPDTEKMMMELTLRQTHRPIYFAPGKPNFEPVAAILGDEKPHLSAFINERSWLLFKLLDVEIDSLDWLNLHPSTWLQNQHYIRIQEFCKEISVVNDAAERAVKDVTEYAKLTADPEHRDNIILVSNDHRGRVKKMKKNNLNDV